MRGGMSDVCRVGVLGCGKVGAAVVRMLGDHAADIERRTGIRLEVAKVAVRDVSRPRGIELAEGVLTASGAEVVADPTVDIVAELIGGIEPARTLILEAFAGGKPVVTANKELLASRGGELFAAAAESGVDLLYEAAVDRKSTRLNSSHVAIS